jgi:hypothetical protein
MLPSAATFFRTVRDTADPIAQDKPLMIGDKHWMLDPDANQGYSWLMANGLPAQPVYNHTFGHLEDAAFPNWVVYTGATETTQAVTGLTIDNVYERCANGQVLMNARTKELMRLTADPASADTTSTVARCHGRGVATDYLVQGDRLLLLTPQMAEGFTTGKPISGVGVYKSFTTGIVSYPVSATYTEESEKYYTGLTPFERDLAKAWVQFNAQAGHSALFGGQVEHASTYGLNYHTVTGLYDFITTNVFSVDGTLGRMDLLDILLEWSQFYRGKAAILCSAAFKAMVTEWAYGQMLYDQDAKTLGMNIENINLGGKIFSLIEVDMLSQDPELMGIAFLCPAGRFQFHPLNDKAGITNTVHYHPIDRDEVHSKEGEITGEFGYEFFEEETWGLITGVDF